MSTQLFLELSRQWADAERRGDAGALEKFIVDDFKLIGPLGFVLNRQQWLDRYRSGDLRNEAFDWQDVNVQEFGDTAIVTGIQTQKTFYRGQENSGRFRVALIYIRNGENWRIAHIQFSGPMPEIPPGSGASPGRPG